MVEDGHWRHGGLHGLDWQNVQTSGGHAFGTSVSNGYNDCVACRDNINNNKHVARGVVYKDASYSPPGNPEVELVVGVTIGSHTIRLYEWLIAWNGNMQIVRWDGPIGHFNFSLPVSGPGPGPLVDGDRVELRYDATRTTDVVLTCYKNGVLVATAHDTTAGRILSGNPGLSFYALSGTNEGMRRYCFAEWSCSV